MALSPAVLETLVAEADPASFRAFVADLWAARGRTVRQTGETVVVTAPDRPEQTLYPLPAGAEPSVPADVDVVVAARDLPADAVLPGVEVVDVADLHQIVRYAVESDDAQRLLADHFEYEPDAEPDGVPALDDSPPPPTTDVATDRAGTPQPSTATDASSPAGDTSVVDGDPAATDDETSSAATGDETTSAATGWVTSRRLLLATLAGGVLAGVGLDRGLGYVTDGDSPADEASAPSGGPDSTETPTPRTVSAPGVSAAGVEDAGALAAAHVSELVDTGYELAASRTVHGLDRQLRSSLSVHVRLATDRAYLVTVATAGPEAPVLLGEPPSAATFWSDGDVYLRRLPHDDGTVTYNSFEPPGGFVASWRYWVTTVPFGGQDGTPERYFRTVFDAIPTTFVGRTTVGGTDRYRLVNVARTPSRRTADLERLLGVDAPRNVDLTASVDERGLVRSFDVSFDGAVGNSPVTVQRTIEYTAVGQTTVDRPSWYDRAVEK
ncbi:hypothetical protein ACKVMT_11520 [Halobacteriales archaeon Cl-PHB]